MALPASVDPLGGGATVCHLVKDSLRSAEVDHALLGFGNSFLRNSPVRRKQTRRSAKLGLCRGVDGNHGIATAQPNIGAAVVHKLVVLLGKTASKYIQDVGLVEGEQQVLQAFLQSTHPVKRAVIANIPSSLAAGEKRINERLIHSANTLPTETGKRFGYTALLR